MGRLLQLLSKFRRWETSLSKMITLCSILLLPSLALSLPASDPSSNVQCTLTYDIVHEEKCHEEEVCHEEHEVIVTTTLVEECEDIVTKHCKSEYKHVHHSETVVGEDSRVVGHEEGQRYYGKRAAEVADESHHGSHSHSSGPHCEEKVDKKCHKVPIHDSHKIPHKKCHTKPHCHPIAVEIPREVCISLSFSQPRPKN